MEKIDRADPYEEPAENFAAMSTAQFNPVATANRWLISPTINQTGSTKSTLYWQA